jgi:hypothetical protein
MSHALTVAAHFAGSADAVHHTYGALMAVLRLLGPVHEQVRPTAIHLVRRTEFAEVMARHDFLILTLISDRNRTSARIQHAEQNAANSWELEVRLAHPNDVDAELREWLRQAYALAL